MEEQKWFNRLSGTWEDNLSFQNCNSHSGSDHSFSVCPTYKFFSSKKSKLVSLHLLLSSTKGTLFSHSNQKLGIIKFLPCFHPSQSDTNYIFSLPSSKASFGKKTTEIIPKFLQLPLPTFRQGNNVTSKMQINQFTFFRYPQLLLKRIKAWKVAQTVRPKNLHAQCLQF